MSLISANQHSLYNCVNMWLGSDSTDIPICLSCECNRNLLRLFFFLFFFVLFCFYLVLFSLCWILRFSDLSHSNILFSCKHNLQLQHKDILDWMQRGGGLNICHIMGYLSTRKLILHQVSSIFLGSGSRGKHSLDTRRTACTAKLREGPDGKKHLRSPPASRLQTTCPDTGIRHTYN